MPAAPQIISLVCHPALPQPVGVSIAVTAQINAHGLRLSFRLTCNPQLIKFPASRLPAPADNLWQRTCCEAFVAATGSTGYREFNFSPSGEWAAYQFTNYRNRDTAFSPPNAPKMTFRALSDGFQLDALLVQEHLPAGNNFQLGLTAVIEFQDCSKSYWALKHCAERPDFHIINSFALFPDTANT